MKFIKLLFIFLGITTLVNAQTTNCNDECCKKVPVKKNQKALTCKLTTPELRERKATVIASLKKQVIEKRD
jgi:hypothetical protein